MVNIIEILIIYGLAGIALFLNAKNDVLKQENKGLRDSIKRDREWHEIDKQCSVELARIDAEFKINKELFRKQCEKR